MENSTGIMWRKDCVLRHTRVHSQSVYQCIYLYKCGKNNNQLLNGYHSHFYNSSKWLKYPTHYFSTHTHTHTKEYCNLFEFVFKINVISKCATRKQFNSLIESRQRARQIAESARHHPQCARRRPSRRPSTELTDFLLHCTLGFFLCVCVVWLECDFVAPNASTYRRGRQQATAALQQQQH